MQIKGIDGIEPERLEHEVRRGGKFVIYHYVISIVVMTFRRPSDIYFIPAGESSVGKGLVFSLLSLVLGWWGIPWGPIHTIGSLYTNFTGGKDVTTEVVDALRAQGTNARAA